MPVLTDLRELKSKLDIDVEDTSEDKNLLFFVETASSWIAELLGRPGLMYKSRTEYYNGTGTQFLPLRSRPVFTTPTIEVYVDEDGLWGARSGAFDAGTTAWTWGEDFGLEIDQDDGTSRSGLLVSSNGFWPKPSVRQRGYLSPFRGNSNGNVKVVYTAGWTVDGMPAQVREACNMLVAKIRYVWPIGMAVSNDGYEERNLGFIEEKKNYWLSLVAPMLAGWRNWKW